MHRRSFSSEERNLRGPCPLMEHVYPHMRNMRDYFVVPNSAGAPTFQWKSRLPAALKLYLGP